jgi:cytochrome c
MNRRKILAVLIGSGASLSSRFASAGDRNTGSATAAKPEPTRRGGIVHGSGAWPDLKLSEPSRQVRSIAYSRGAYSVTTADGNTAFFLESDLRFKIDSSELGPDAGKPVIMPAGTEGDRAWLFFSSPHEIGGFIECRRS